MRRNMLEKGSAPFACNNFFPERPFTSAQWIFSYFNYSSRIISCNPFMEQREILNFWLFKMRNTALLYSYIRKKYALYSVLDMFVSNFNVVL